MSHNKLLSLPAVIQEIGAGRQAKNGRESAPSITKLDVANNNIIALPSGLGAMTKLEVLILNHNKVLLLPCLCDRLSRLQSFVCAL